MHTSTGVGASGSDSITGGTDSQANETGSEHVGIVLLVQGTDGQGNQINITETQSIDGSANEGLTDDDTEAADGTNTEVLHDDSTGTGTYKGGIVGTITSIDPTTGVKTVTSENLTVTANGTNNEDESDTDITSPSGGSSDNATQSDTGSGGGSWNDTETVTKTNPDGSSAGTTTTTSGGSDTVNWNNTLSGPSAQLARTLQAAESGNTTSSDPNVGSSSWSNQAFDAATATQVFGSQQLSIALGASGSSGGAGGGSSGSGASTGGPEMIDGMTRDQFVNAKIYPLMAVIQRLQAKINASTDPAFQQALRTSQQSFQNILAGEQAKLGICQTAQNSGVQPGVDQIDISAAGEPGFGESLIPVWGSARYAAARFQEGNFSSGQGLWNYAKGVGWFALAVTDVTLVRSAGTALFKGGARVLGIGGSKAAAEAAAEGAAKMVAAKGAVSLEEFMAARGIKELDEGARKAWEVYNRAKNAKGLIIGGAPEVGAHGTQGGFDILSTLDKNWTWLINQAWLDGAIEARLPIKIITRAENLKYFPGLRREIAYLIQKGYRLEGGWLLPPPL